MNILRMSLAGGCLIGAALLLRALFQARLPRWAFLALWAAAALRLLVPFTIPSPASAYNAARRIPAIVESASPVAYPVLQGLTQPVAVLPAPTLPLPWWRALWLAGAAACAAYFIATHLRARRFYAQSLPCRDPAILSLLEPPLRRKVSLRLSDRIRCPLTFGLIRPVILLPKRVSSNHLPYVLSHELWHIRHLDALWRGILALCACVHWFNPLVWAMLVMAGRDLELCCDQGVTARLTKPCRRDYALLLLNMEEKKALLGPLSNGFGKSAIEERIRAIMTMKKSTLLATLVAFVLVAACVAAFATSAPALPQQAIEDALLLQRSGATSPATGEAPVGNVPSQGDYCRSAWKMDYAALCQSCEIWNGRVFLCDGIVSDLWKEAERTVILDVGGDGQPQYVVLSNLSSVEAPVVGARYRAFADVAGSQAYNGKDCPRLICRYLFAED